MNPPFVGLGAEYRGVPRRFGSGVATCERGGIDHRPPRTFGDDRSTLVALLQYQRDSVVRKVAGLTQEQARWSPVPSGTSLLWLLRHLGRAEAIWVLRPLRRPRRRARPPGRRRCSPTTTSTRSSTATGGSGQLVDATVAASDLDAICVGEDDQLNPDLRWVLAHLVEETARHAGHADILRELLDGSVGR